jgi:hypothetical protein
LCLGNNIKRRLRQLEQLDEVFAKSGGLNAKTFTRDDNDGEGVVYQQHNTMTFPVSQPLTTQPDNNCSWLAGQNEASVTDHTELGMDITSQLESNQFMFGLITPHTNRSPSQQFDYFANTSNQDQNATLAPDRQTSGQATLPSGTQPPSQPPPAPARTRSDTAIQPIQSDVGRKLSSEPHAPSPTNHQGGTTEGRLRSSSSGTTHNTSASQSDTGSGCSTPLHQAAANGHVQIVRFLVLKGANATARNESQQTVLHLAAERGHEGVIEHVLQSECEEIKASIDWIDDQGFTALHRAAAGGHEECVRVLVEAGADIESSKRSSQLISSMFSQ